MNVKMSFLLFDSKCIRISVQRSFLDGCFMRKQAYGRIPLTVLIIELNECTEMI